MSLDPDASVSPAVDQFLRGPYAEVPEIWKAEVSSASKSLDSHIYQTLTSCALASCHTGIMGSVQPHSSCNEGLKKSIAWQDLVAKKKKENQQKTPSDWYFSGDFAHSLDAGPLKRTNVFELEVPKRSGILTSREIEITEAYTAVDLLARLAKGNYTALEVTTAFCKRAAIAQQLLSCLTEVFYGESGDAPSALGLDVPGATGLSS